MVYNQEYFERLTNYIDDVCLRFQTLGVYDYSLALSDYMDVPDTEYFMNLGILGIERVEDPNEPIILLVDVEYFLNDTDYLNNHIFYQIVSDRNNIKGQTLYISFYVVYNPLNLNFCGNDYKSMKAYRIEELSNDVKFDLSDYKLYVNAMFEERGCDAPDKVSNLLSNSVYKDTIKEPCMLHWGLRYIDYHYNNAILNLDLSNSQSSYYYLIHYLLNQGYYARVRVTSKGNSLEVLQEQFDSWVSDMIIFISSLDIEQQEILKTRPFLSVDLDSRSSNEYILKKKQELEKLFYKVNMNIFRFRRR